MQINKDDVVIRKCSVSDVDSIYQLQSIVVDNFRDEEKGYLLPFKYEEFVSFINNELSGDIYGAFVDDLMVGWIFLSIEESIKDILIYIPNVTGVFCDIDGVMVHPFYRGNNLQVMLLEYVFDRAIDMGIDNVLGEITYGNVYSFNNAVSLGFVKEGEYYKDGIYKRDILVKKLKRK